MSTTSEFDFLHALLRDIAPDSVWRHHSGRLYRVMFLIDMDHVENGLTVIYENIDAKTRHGASAKDWHRSMTKINSGTE